MKKLLEPLAKSFKYLVAATIVIVPLYPKFPFIQVPGTYVAIRFEDFILAAIAALTFIIFVSSAKRIVSDKIGRAILIFLLVGVVSLLSGIFLTQTVTPSIGILHLLRRIEYFVPFFAVMVLFPYEKDKNLEFYVKVLILTVFVVFLYGLGQKYLNLPVIMTQNSEASKGIAMRWTPGAQLTSTFAGHYDLAAFMVLVLPIFISLFFTVKDKVSKIVLVAVSLSGYWLLVSTASRISFGSYLIGSVIALFAMKKYKAMIIVLVLSLVLSVFSPGLYGRYGRLINVYFNKVKGMMSMEVRPKFTVLAQEITLPTTPPAPTPTPVPKLIFEDRSTSIRLNVEWPRAIRAFMKNPLIGTGYSSIGLASDNDYLRLFAEVGILGFFAFGLILTRILLVFARAFPLPRKLSGINLGFTAGVIGGITGVLINALFIDVFEASKFAIIFWLLVGLAVYSVKNSLHEQ